MSKFYLAFNLFWSNLTLVKQCSLSSIWNYSVKPSVITHEVGMQVAYKCRFEPNLDPNRMSFTVLMIKMAFEGKYFWVQALLVSCPTLMPLYVKQNSENKATELLFYQKQPGFGELCCSFQQGSKALLRQYSLFFSPQGPFILNASEDWYLGRRS